MEKVFNETVLTYKGRRVRVYQTGLYWAEIIDDNGNTIKGSITYSGSTASEAMELMRKGIDRLNHYNG